MNAIWLTCVVAALGSGAGAEEIKVRIENRVPWFDEAPMIRGGAVVVPIRSMIDAMDGTLRWDLEQRTVTGWANGRRVDVVLNSRSARVNGKSVQMDEPAFLHKGRIFVPLRFIAEATGHLVSFEGGWHTLEPKVG